MASINPSGGQKLPLRDRSGKFLNMDKIYAENSQRDMQSRLLADAQRIINSPRPAQQPARQIPQQQQRTIDAKNIYINAGRMNQQSMQVRQANTRAGAIAGAATTGAIIAGSDGAAAEQAMMAGNMMRQKFDDKESKKLQKKEEKVADKTKDALDDLHKGGSGTRSYDIDSTKITVLVFLAVLMHFYEIIRGFPRPTTIGVMPVPYDILVGYIAIILFSFYIHNWKFPKGDMGAVLIAILFPYGLQMMQSILVYQWEITGTVILMLLPPVVIYYFMQYREHTAGKKIINFYFFILMCIAILILLSSPFFKETGITTPALKNPGDAMSMFGKTIVNSWNTFTKNIDTQIKSGVAQAEGQQYSSQAEQQRGLFIDNLKTVGAPFYTSSDVWIEGKVHVENIDEKYPVRVTFKCGIPDNNVVGTAIPTSLVMTGNDNNVVDCHLGSLPVGGYQVKITGTFEFREDASVVNYFIDQNLPPDYIKKDPVTAQDSAYAKIPSYAASKYSGGPVIMGLPALSQPLRIDTSVSGADGQEKYPFGVSLTNDWSTGSIVRGINFTLEVPQGVTLPNYTCTRNYQTTNVLANGRTQYIFYMDDKNLKSTFDSVTCRMKTVDPSALISFIQDRPPDTTFNGVAYFVYAVDGSLYINVAKDFVKTGQK